MIRSFADKETEKLFRGHKSKAVPAQIRERTLAKLLILNAVSDVEELRIPPDNHLEKLRESREGQWSIRINQQYRVVFIFESGDAYNAEVTDYH